MNARLTPERIANSIRLLQADFHDADERERRDVIHGELQRVLETMPASEQESFLDALESLFPVGFGGGDGAATDAASAPVQASSPGRSVDDLSASELVDRLRELAPRMKASERSEIIAMLGEIGLQPPRPSRENTTQFDASRMDRLAQSLGLGSAADVDADRVIELTLRWRKFVNDLDVLARNLWAEYRRNAQGRVTGTPPAFADVIAMCREYAKADASVPPNDLKRVMDRAYALLAGMLSGSKESIDTQIREARQTLSPEAIQAAAGGKANPKKLWMMYEQVASQRRAFDDREVRADFYAKLVEVVIQFVDAAEGGSSRG